MKQRHPTSALDLRHAAPTGPRRLWAQADSARMTDLASHRLHVSAPEPPGRSRRELIRLIQDSGLRGRGGGGFPTGKKLEAVANGRSRPVVVVNGTEGEPASRKDATLLQLQPHLVLDGAAQAAAAVGASEVLVCIERTNTPAIEAVARALDERRSAEPDGVATRLLCTPPRYVAGEESALVHWINGGDAKPTRVPPRPFERGVSGRPTLVNNAETLAHVAHIVEYGAPWFRTMGTESEPGTALLTLSGAVTRNEVLEAPVGIGLVELLAEHTTFDRAGAVLVGGYFGSWLSAETAARARLCDESLRPLGGGLGCGAVVVLPGHACGVVESARVLTWMAAETAGQCGPCVHGLHAIAGRFSQVSRGAGRRDDLSQLHRWAAQVEGRGACRFPDGAVRFLRSALDVFGADLQRHAKGRPCAGVEHAPVLPIPRIWQTWR